MSPRAVSPARARAVELLREILREGAPATPLLADRSSDLSSADADLLREIVLGVLRTRTALDGELAAACRVPLERLARNLREILEVALYQIRHLDRVPDYAAVDEAVRHARACEGEGAGKLVNAVLRNLLRKHPLPPGEGWGEGETHAAALARRFSHPEFLVARWLERLGAETTREILASDNRRSGLDLMVNSRKTTREELIEALRREGIATEPSAFSPLALSVASGNPLRSRLFEAGHFSVQDVGSQALPLLLPPRETLLDLAAAPGGKSFAALLLGRVRRSIALDRSVSRLRLLEANRRRLGVSEVLPVAADFLALPLPGACFDRILFDAPCSGTGTLRKHPEIRYRVSPEAIERLSQAQEAGLTAAALFLAPGGYLLYSTCSLETEENERVVQRVLRRLEDLRAAPIEPPEGLRPFVVGHRFQILPGATNDGFTAHLLTRTG